MQKIPEDDIIVEDEKIENPQFTIKEKITFQHNYVQTQPILFGQHLDVSPPEIIPNELIEFSYPDGSKGVMKRTKPKEEEIPKIPEGAPKVEKPKDVHYHVNGFTCVDNAELYKFCKQMYEDHQYIQQYPDMSMHLGIPMVTGNVKLDFFTHLHNMHKKYKISLDYDSWARQIAILFRQKDRTTKPKPPVVKGKRKYKF